MWSLCALIYNESSKWRLFLGVGVGARHVKLSWVRDPESLHLKQLVTTSTGPHPHHYGYWNTLIPFHFLLNTFVWFMLTPPEFWSINNYPFNSSTISYVKLVYIMERGGSRPVKTSSIQSSHYLQILLQSSPHNARLLILPFLLNFQWLQKLFLWSWCSFHVKLLWS